MNSTGKRLIRMLEHEFGHDQLWSQKFDYIMLQDDLVQAHKILNKCLFGNKLSDIDIIVEPYVKQLSKGSFAFGYIAKTKKYRQRLRFTSEPGKDNFFKIICVLIHEMIHQYDFNFGPWSKFTNRMNLVTNFQELTLKIGDYDIHNNPLFDSKMTKANSYGFNVQKIYSRKDQTFMRKVDETAKISEDIDEEPIENRNIISTDYAKVMYDNIKTSAHKNIITKKDGSWMIEVE